MQNRGPQQGVLAMWMLKVAPRMPSWHQALPRVEERKVSPLDEKSARRWAFRESLSWALAQVLADPPWQARLHQDQGRLTLSLDSSESVVVFGAHMCASTLAVSPCLGEH
jgi:hypothetical protein